MCSDLVAEFNQVLSRVDAEAVAGYSRCSGMMVAGINEALGRHEGLSALLGPNDPDVMSGNHANHAAFMSFVLSAGSAKLLVDTVAWVYRSYLSRGFSPEYFIAELSAWIDALAQHIDRKQAEPVIDVYRLMIHYHPRFVDLSRQPQSSYVPECDESGCFQRFFEALLKPSLDDAIRVSRACVSNTDQLHSWWLSVAKPAMYEVGRLWENGSITVGQEHIATAIVQRVMAIHYQMIQDVPRNGQTLIVAASPAELHELGARMMADILELKGWNVVFTGADTPTDSVADLVTRHRAVALCVSTTMTFNLVNAKQMITALRSSLPIPTKVLVGGQAYRSDPEMFRWVGADCLAQTVDDVIARCVAIESG